jgi:hypothetical protein
VVRVGDLGDASHANTLSIPSAPLPFRRQSKSQVGRRSDGGMYPLTFRQALSDFQDMARTHLYRGDRQHSDHGLVSAQFYDPSQQRFRSFKEQRIWNDHVVENDISGPSRAVSDHRLVRARLVWDPAKTGPPRCRVRPALQEKAGCRWAAPGHCGTSVAAGLATDRAVGDQKLWRMPACTPCELFPGDNSELAPSTLKALCPSLLIVE